MWPHGQSEAEPNAAVVRGSAPTAQDGSTTDKSGGGAEPVVNGVTPRTRASLARPGRARPATPARTGLR